MIREPASGEFPAIRAIIRHAFDRADEANLVEQLRADSDVLAEFVAAEGVGLQAHVLYSRLRIERGSATFDIAALAPVAVLPACQRRGLGAALIAAGNAWCAEAGLAAIIVLGDPAYYQRFGFSALAAESLDAPFSGAHFMALELLPGALAEGGRVHYARAFGELP